jgi:aerobic carbon-monoxide dehydrogenase medium subunit
MSILEYHRPASPGEALGLLQRLEVTTVPLVASPRPTALNEIQAAAVVDLSGLDLAFVSVEEDEVRLGSMTPLQMLIETPALQSLVQGILPETARLAGHLGLRQLATLEGALLSRKSLPELTLALLALEAEAVVAKKDGGRQDVPLAQYLALQLHENELLLEVKFAVEPGAGAKLDAGAKLGAGAKPGAGAKIGGAVERVARAPRDGAVMAVAAVLRMEANICRYARVALSHAGSAAELMVVLIPRVEGQVVTASLLYGVAEAVQTAVNPVADFRAGADYRREMAGVLTRRALEAAWKRASA